MLAFQAVVEGGAKSRNAAPEKWPITLPVLTIETSGIEKGYF
jgi:hypothetical protein